MIAALYVATGGCYFGLEGVDPWDIERDARKYAGPYPVVAHPPCNRWVNLGRLNYARYGGEHNRPGNDGGTFAAALAAVMTWGGVLEHPAHSAAWRAHGLHPPGRAGWTIAGYGGWTCQVEQGHYGHRARKATWLYVHGVSELPSLLWGKSSATAWCTPGASLEVSRGKSIETIGKRERLATPPQFRDLLLSIARSAAQKAA